MSSLRQRTSSALSFFENDTSLACALAITSTLRQVETSNATPRRLPELVIASICESAQVGFNGPLGVV
jgi:hypothetical protein